MTTLTPVWRTAAAAATLAIVLTPTVRANAQVDRPDLLDVPEVRFVDGEDSNNSLAVMQEDYYPAVRRFVSGSVLRPGTVTGGSLRWALFEPDKTKRKKNGLALQQGDYVALRIYGGTSGGTFYGMGLVPGCKATTKVSSESADPNSISEAKWSVKCKPSPDPLTTLGLSAAERARFEKVFGSTAIKIKGRGAPALMLP